MNWMQPLKEKDFFGIMSLPGRVEDTAPERSGTDFEQILLQKIGTVPGLKEQQEAFGFSGQGGERKAAQKEYKDRRSLQPVPRPVCVCFYNGTEEQPEKQVLKLSDAYQSEGDIEVRVTMLNINCGKNQRLMDACEPLKEYAWLVDTVRRHQQEKMDLDAAVDAAISEMPDEFVIKPFLMENRAEGTKMSAACGGGSESEFQ